MATISLNQITVSTRSYELSHINRPKGYGVWAFAIGCTPKQVEKDINLAWWSKPAKYSDAVKEAKKQAQQKGCTTIYVLP